MSQRRNRRAGVEDRWTRTIRIPDGTSSTVPSAADGKGLRWRARYVDDDGKEHAKGFSRKADAQSWLNEITTQLTTGTYVDPQLGKITFASYYREWADRQVWESGTRHAMDLAVKSVPFGNQELLKLRPSHFEAWVKEMKTSGLAPTTIRTRFANAGNVVRAAIRDKCLRSDPTLEVKLPRTRKPEAAMRIPAAEQIGAAITACEEVAPWFGTFIAVCAFAGLRKGEASALKVSDISFIKRELKVERQVQWTDTGEMEIRPPKYGSERTIDIPDELVTIISEYVRLWLPGDDQDRWLFPGARDTSKPAHSATVGRWWRKISTLVGFDYRLHDCRHFFASGLIAAGCDVVTVQRALGHSAASITLDVYGHLWPDSRDRTRQAAAGLIDQAFGRTADALRTEGQI